MGCKYPSKTLEEIASQKRLELKLKTNCSFNIKKCKSILSTLPKRTKTDLDSFKKIIKSKTNKLSKLEKSYILFLYICQNLEYDTEVFFDQKIVEYTPEDVFKNGITVCSGYCILYKDIAEYLSLEVEIVTCYAKGMRAEPNKKITNINHAYNIIKINNNWFPIDTTWAAGYVDTNKQFKKSLNEFYFFTNPEFLIRSHFPFNTKYQLTEKKYTLEEFSNWPNIEYNYFNYEFIKFLPENGLIEFEEENFQKFIIYGEKIYYIKANCEIYLYKNNDYYQEFNLFKINYFDYI